MALVIEALILSLVSWCYWMKHVRAFTRCKSKTLLSFHLNLMDTSLAKSHFLAKLPLMQQHFWAPGCRQQGDDEGEAATQIKWLDSLECCTLSTRRTPSWFVLTPESKSVAEEKAEDPLVCTRVWSSTTTGLVWHTSRHFSSIIPPLAFSDGSSMVGLGVFPFSLCYGSLDNYRGKPAVNHRWLSTQ